jgi:tripartite-type tricarboxylate transporter receptor subunit TctC
MSAELFKLMTRTDILNVTYRGLALAYTDLMMNRVQVTFDNLPGSIGFIRQSKLRALAVTTTTRSPALPDIPTLAEFIPGYEASAGTASARREAPRKRSLAGSTKRSMPAWPIRRSRRGLWI